MTLLISIVIVLYALLILTLNSGLRQLKDFEPDDSPAVNSFSVIVVFRNEIENLANLIGNFKNLDYPNDKLEILLIDDDSDDGSLELALQLQEDNKELNLKIIENRTLSSSPKKEAIEKGVSTAKFDWILTTDADCILAKNHLRAIDQYIQKYDPIFVAGPVVCKADDSFLQGFQLLDFLSLQGSTMGGFGGRNLNASIKPFMCNGANLCYLKTEFILLNGYSGSKHIASGDDVFLLEKMIVRDSKKVHFIKSRAAVVSTLPKYSWKELVEQRKRWAAKTSSIGNGFGKAVGALVLLANLALIIGLGSAIGGLIHWKSLGILFLVKINVDFILIYKTALFFYKKEALRSFIASSLLYPFFVVLVSVLALNGSYHWKGRSFRK